MKNTKTRLVAPSVAMSLVLAAGMASAQSTEPFPAVFELSSLNGANGFVLNGVDVDDRSGRSVSSAGDVNGDGIDDLIIGARRANPNGNSYAGESYVVFGDATVGSTGSINLSSLNGTNGFVLNGIDGGDLSGLSVSSAGDVNDDGIDDLIIGASSADPNGNNDAGESYVVFGGSNVGSGGVIELATLNGTNGFVLNGIDTSDSSGFSVSSAGDVNGDGIDDLIIGADRADPNGNSVAGESYVVFGRDLSPPGCPADLTGDGELNFFDVSAFLSAFASANPIADFTNDGQFNFFDVSAFLSAYIVGCP